MRQDRHIVRLWKDPPEGGGGSDSAGTRPDVARDEDVAVLDEDPRLVCRLCRALVTRESERVSHGGGHTHVFFNPHGHVFEIGCFAQAPGVATVGPASVEFTWFPGYAWRIAICRRCQTHLGWRFSGETVFHGLILDMLDREA